MLCILQIAIFLENVKYSYLEILVDHLQCALEQGIQHTRHFGGHGMLKYTK